MIHYKNTCILDSIVILFFFRYKLLAFLGITEFKLAEWTGRFGHQNTVENMLKEYSDIVDKQKLFETFDKLLADCKKVSEIYKMGGAGKP